METKNCLICGKLIVKPANCSRKHWETKRNYCSLSCASLNPAKIAHQRESLLQRYRGGLQPWNKGIPQTEEAKRNLSVKLKAIAKEKGFGKWMTGKKQSPETRRKKSEAGKRIVAEGRHNFYIDGRTTGNRAIRTSLEYKLWRTAVFERDDYTCIWCGARSGNGKKITLHADHIKQFAFYPELRFAIDNGRTLCITCHKTTETYAGKGLKKK